MAQLRREKIHPVFLLDEAQLLREQVLEHVHILANGEPASRRSGYSSSGLVTSKIVEIAVTYRITQDAHASRCARLEPNPVTLWILLCFFYSPNNPLRLHPGVAADSASYCAGAGVCTTCDDAHPPFTEEANEACAGQKQLRPQRIQSPFF